MEQFLRLGKNPNCLATIFGEKWEQATSPFHAYLEQLFNCHVDVQWTTGRLNYINGYTTKAHDAMDFRLGAEFTDSPANDRWPTTSMSQDSLYPRGSPMVPRGRAYDSVVSCVEMLCTNPVAMR